MEGVMLADNSSETGLFGTILAIVCFLIFCGIVYFTEIRNKKK